MLNYTYTDPNILGEVKLAKDDSQSTEWTFNLMMGINFEIKTKKITNPDGTIKEPYYFYSEQSGTRKLMLEPKPNTSLFYIYYYPNDDIDAKKNIYIIYKIDKENRN